MAKIPLKEITFPGLDNTYTIPEIDDTLSTAGKAADAKKTGDEISELKEDFTTTASKEDMLKSFPTDTASGAVASFADGANVPVKSLIVDIDPVQSGSGDPSPTNIRPISGWSEVNVQRTGKNLLPKYADGATKTQNGITATANADGSITYVGTSTGSFWGIGNSPTIRLKAGSYILSANNNANINVNIVNADTNAYIDSISGNNSKMITFGTDTNIYYYTSVPSGKTVNTTATYQLELGSTATPYEPYNGQSINIALGQTVYSGKLDVVSGELVIDGAMADLNSATWSSMDNVANCFSCGLTIDSSINAYPDVICDAYARGSSYNDVKDNNGKIGINRDRTVLHDNRFSTPSEFNTYLQTHSIKFVYPIPSVTVQLTPHEVRSLLGSNNVWADTGDTEVTYRADPTLYIQRLTEPDADMVADANITSGSYFMVGNTLYKATANIANGSAIVPNTNCTRKSLSEALNEINA